MFDNSHNYFTDYISQNYKLQLINFRRKKVLKQKPTFITCEHLLIYPAIVSGWKKILCTNFYTNQNVCMLHTLGIEKKTNMNAKCMQIQNIITL